MRQAKGQTAGGRARCRGGTITMTQIEGTTSGVSVAPVLPRIAATASLVRLARGRAQRTHTVGLAVKGLEMRNAT